MSLHLILLFIIGLVIGSFINVVSLRYKEGGRLMSHATGYGANFLTRNIFFRRIIEPVARGFNLVGGRSYCPICRKQLSWYELVPVLSFVFLKGKCRHCGHKISLQYPIVELLSGTIFVAIPLAYQPQLITHSNSIQLLVIGCWLLVGCALLLLSAIDFRLYIIPDSIQLFLIACGGALIALNQSLGNFGAFKGSFLGHYALLAGGRNGIWSNHLLAVLVGLVFFGLVILISRGRAMGVGDLKLIGALGFIFGWPDILMIIFLSFIIGALASVPLLIRKKKGMKDAIPFGPFLAIASVCVFLFGFQIMDIYFKIFL